MIPSWMGCWMNMYFSSMCLALLETPMRVAILLPDELSVCHLEVDLVCKNFSKEILEV